MTYVNALSKAIALEYLYNRVKSSWPDKNDEYTKAMFLDDIISEGFNSINSVIESAKLTKMIENMVVEVTLSAMVPDKSKLN